ncbi:MAG: flagellar motor protein MotA, partial [Brevundimonas mediterranea]
MLNSKKTNILLAMAGAAVLMASSPVLAQAPAEPTPAAAPAAAPTAMAPAADAANPQTMNESVGGGHGAG